MNGVAPDRRLGLGGEPFPRFPQHPQAFFPTKENEVVAPAQMIAIGDAMLSLSLVDNPPLLHGTGDLSRGVQYASRESVERNIYLSKRHRGNWNVVFCDGHVEQFKARRLFDPMDAGARRLWNNDNQPHPEFRSPAP